MRQNYFNKEQGIDRPSAGQIATDFDNAWRTTSSTCSSIVMWVVSMTRASSAWRRGLSARLVSILSRCIRFSMTSSRSTSCPRWSSYFCLRKALTRMSAVIKSLSSAFGNTTVPISLPSITTALSLAMRLCCSTSASRTSFRVLT